MIHKKYIELINKEIDGVISSAEKNNLDEYLLKNPDAKNYYDEINLTNQYLSLLPDQEPSENLKKKIINSINFNKYSPEIKNKSFWNLLGVPKLRLAYTFAAGIIAGIIVFAIFFNNNNINLKNISGTVAVSDNNVKTIREIPVKFPGAIGNIELKQLENNIWLNVNFNTNQNFKMIVKYPGNLDFNNIKPALDGNIEFSKGKDFIQVNSSGNQQYSLLFSKNNSEDSDLQIKIINSDEIVYEHKISIK